MLGDLNKFIAQKQQQETEAKATQDQPAPEAALEANVNVEMAQMMSDDIQITDSEKLSDDDAYPKKEAAPPTGGYD